MFLIIIPILIFAITCLCLPQLLIQIILGFTGYILCRALRYKPMAKMIVVITVFSCLSIIIGKVMPIVKEEQEKQQYIEEKIDDVKKFANPKSKYFTREQVESEMDKKINDSIPDRLWFIRFMTEYPRVDYEKDKKDNKNENKDKDKDKDKKE